MSEKRDVGEPGNQIIKIMSVIQVKSDKNPNQVMEVKNRRDGTVWRLGKKVDKKTETD